jgi:hypothetical protein
VNAWPLPQAALRTPAKKNETTPLHLPILVFSKLSGRRSVNCALTSTVAQRRDTFRAFELINYQ